MPPPPPRPPPGPGPPPAPVFNSQAAKPPPAAVDRSAVLGDIRKGARLKKVDRSEIRDRSSPLVAGAAGPSASSSDTSLSSGSGPARSRPENGSATTSSSMSPQAALGGLFANGMPTLKRTGLRQVEKGSPTDDAPSNSSTLAARRSPPTAVIPSQPKPSPPPPPSIAPSSQLTHSSSTTSIKPVAPPPKPANLQVQRRSIEFEKPILTPKPANFPTNGPFNQITSGSATVRIQGTTERPSIAPKMNTAPPQKPKHPPPPLPTNPPPTRNISQTMPRPVKHQRPSLPAEITNSGKFNGSPPTPPPVPGRPPSFRKNSEARPGVQPPPPPPPPPAIFPSSSQPSQPVTVTVGLHSTQQPMRAPAVHHAPYRAGGAVAPPPPPPSAATLPHSTSVHSLPGSPSSAQRPGPPKRHESLQNVLVQQQMDQTLRNVPVQKSVAAPQPPRQQPKTMTRVQEFEVKFCFHPISELPPPMPFSSSTKTYPSAKTRTGSTRPTAPAPPVR